MPKCRDNRRKKVSRRQKERIREFHTYHKYCSWVYPFCPGMRSPKRIKRHIMKHGVKQRRIGNWRPLKK